MAEKIILPHRINHKFVVNHSDWIFVYGSDVVRKAFFGQAYACGNEPNTYPVFTLFKDCPSGTKYFHDTAYSLWLPHINESIDAIPIDGRPIIVFRGIGTGCSRMSELAPQLYNHMVDRLHVIQYPNVEIDYHGLVYPLYASNA